MTEDSVFIGGVILGLVFFFAGFFIGRDSKGSAPSPLPFPPQMFPDVITLVHTTLTDGEHEVQMSCHSSTMAPYEGIMVKGIESSVFNKAED